MADADVQVTAGSGTKIDTRTVGASTDEHRQVVVVGDPVTAAEVARTTTAFETASTTPGVGLLAALAPDRRFSSVSLATAANSTQAWDVNGANNTLVHVGTTTTGTMIFEVSADGTNWVTADVWEGVANTWQVGAFTPTAQKVYRVHTNGWRSLRARTATTLGATVALIATLSPITSIQSGALSVPIPHNTGFIPLGIKFTATTAQTSVNLLAGTAGQKIYVPNIQIGTGGTTAGRVSIYWGTGAFTAGTSETLFDAEFAPSATVRPGAVLAFTVPMGGASATGDNLRITTSAGITVYVTGQAYKA